jgi:Mn-dependent DtxR family transcriptional regulator
MRTTMNLPDSLLERARRKAEEEGRTVTSLVEEALRDLLSRPTARPEVEPLPTDGIPNGRMLVDIDDKDALWEVLDADGFK